MFLKTLKTLQCARSLMIILLNSRSQKKFLYIAARFRQQVRVSDQGIF